MEGITQNKENINKKKNEKINTKRLASQSFTDKFFKQTDNIKGVNQKGLETGKIRSFKLMSKSNIFVN